MSRRYYKRHTSGKEFYTILVISSVLCVVLKISRWKLILIFELILAVVYATKDLLLTRMKRKKLVSSRIYEIDKMDGVTFEQLLMAHFEKNGYKVRSTPKSNDYGADLILIKDGEKVVVQAKRYKGKVGVAAVQQAYSSMGYYKASRCMVITNAYYTSQAKKLAKANGVILWDRDTLINKFKIKER